MDERNGIVIGTERGVVDWFMLTLPNFSGHFQQAGHPLNLTTKTTQAQIAESFGEPYWTDRSDGEVIMFYEYQRGTIELQFEFGDEQELTCITLSQNGVLSDEKQRKLFNVNKPWPPQ